MPLPLTRPATAPGLPAFETMAFKRLEGFLLGRDLFVILCKEAPPTDADWSRYMADVQALVAKHPENLAGVPTLALSDGGAPTTMQRTRITALQEGTTARAPIAIISDSPLIRGATRALGLFNPKLKVFAPGSFAKALEHLGVLPSSASIVKRQVLETQQLFGAEPRLRVVRALFARSGAE